MSASIVRSREHLKGSCWADVRTVEDLQTCLDRFPDTKDGAMDCLREDFEEILDLGGRHGAVTLPAQAA